MDLNIKYALMYIKYNTQNDSVDKTEETLNLCTVLKTLIVINNFIL